MFRPSYFFKRSLLPQSEEWLCGDKWEKRCRMISKSPGKTDDDDDDDSDDTMDCLSLIGQGF